jgi:alpha-tubulin suppressor-like RCC1 family protein
LNPNTRHIYSWGNGIYGQLGSGNETNSQPVPKKIEDFNRINKNIIKLFAAFDASASITEEGDVYVWGKTKDGALGIFPGGSLNIKSPTLFHHFSQLDSKIADIDFSKEHGGLVTTNGILYTWGVDMYNKLGHKIEEAPVLNLRARKIPKAGFELVKFGKVTLPNNKKARSIRCGYNHTMCLTDDGEVFTWGYGKDGSLGHENSDNYDLPKAIEYFKRNNIKIQKIECGDYFSLALSEDGKLYAWGQNNFGQLGLGQVTQQLKVNVPTEILFGNKMIKDIYAGEDHSSCVTNDGEAYIWGYGIDGRLGNGNKTNVNIPYKIIINNEKIKKISCGGHHTAILTEDGNLFMCGNGRDGELGRGDLLESHSVIRDEPLLVK